MSKLKKIIAAFNRIYKNDITLEVCKYFIYIHYKNTSRIFLTRGPSNNDITFIKFIQDIITRYNK